MTSRRPYRPQDIGNLRERIELQRLELTEDDMGGLIEAYSEVARRLGILGENEKIQSGGPRLVQ